MAVLISERKKKGFYTRKMIRDGDGYSIMTQGSILQEDTILTASECNNTMSKCIR